MKKFKQYRDYGFGDQEIRIISPQNIETRKMKDKIQEFL
jgi:hypothetical protein